MLSDRETWRERKYGEEWRRTIKTLSHKHGVAERLGKASRPYSEYYKDARTLQKKEIFSWGRLRLFVRRRRQEYSSKVEIKKKARDRQ